MCRYRVSKAQVFTKRFHRKITHQDKPEKPPLFYKYFPPRREWHKFRPKRRQRAGTHDHTLFSLLRTINWHKRKNSTQPWLQDLDNLISNIGDACLANMTSISLLPNST
ncbi:hypothetical protein [Rubritalea tangerina]|uniref:hypothetical protein n=1 Tax=Rubritalea tangerina TaxID=430798 RepID=UPI003607B6E0